MGRPREEEIPAKARAVPSPAPPLATLPAAPRRQLLVVAVLLQPEVRTLPTDRGRAADDPLGSQEEVDRLRRSAKCEACGHVGASLSMPSWGGATVGFMPWPERFRDAAKPEQCGGVRTVATTRMAAIRLTS